MHRRRKKKLTLHIFRYSTTSLRTLLSFLGHSFYFSSYKKKTRYVLERKRKKKATSKYIVGTRFELSTSSFYAVGLFIKSLKLKIKSVERENLTYLL